MDDPLTEFLEEETRKSEAEWRQRQEDEAFAEEYKYNPVISSGPGQPLEVTVGLPDGHTDFQVLEAMDEAIRKLGLT